MFDGTISCPLRSMIHDTQPTFLHLAHRFDIWGSQQLGVYRSIKKQHLKLRINSVKLIVLGRSQFGPIRMPVCMELVAACTLTHIEALVSMVELRKHFNTGSSRRLLKRVHATHWCVCLVYNAESYIIFTLGCVGFVKLFRVRFYHKTEKPTRVFLFSSLLCIEQQHGGFDCIWALLAASRCLWYRTSKSRFSRSLIVILNTNTNTNIKVQVQSETKVQSGMLDHLSSKLPLGWAMAMARLSLAWHERPTMSTLQWARQEHPE